MKKMKKLASLLVALVMVMAMAMPVFANGDPAPAPTAGNGNYTVKIETVAGHTYKIYQLLVGDVSSNTDILSNTKVGTGAKDGATVESIVNAVDGKSGIALSNAAAELIGSTIYGEAIVGNGTEQTVTLPGGYYVITDEYTDPDGVQTTNLSATMVQLAGDLTITPKAADKPNQPDKDVNKESVSIGDIVTYTLSGDIPSMVNYERYKYVMVDIMSKGLTQQNILQENNQTVKIEVGNTFTAKLVAPVKDGVSSPTIKDGQPLPEKNVTFKVTGVTANADGSTTMRFAIVNAIDYADYAGYTFAFDYTALVNKDAAMNTAIPNTAYVEHSSNPDHVGEGDDFKPDEPKGQTPEITVNVYTTNLVLKKIDGATKNILLGAEFKIDGGSTNVGFITGQKYVLNANGTWYKLVDGAYTETAPAEDGSNANKYASTTDKYILEDVNEVTYTNTAQTTAQAFVNSEGLVTFTGLGEGIYTITEETTPDGYNTLAPFYIHVVFDTEKKEYSAYRSNAEGDPIDANGNVITTEGNEIKVNLGGDTPNNIENNKGSQLPSTGGIGTTIFYVVGTILVLGAGILLVTKRRMKAQ